MNKETAVTVSSDAKIQFSPICVSDLQAAKILGISRSGLHRFVRAGLLPRPIKLGRRSLYRVSELEQMINHLAAACRGQWPRRGG